MSKSHIDPFVSCDDFSQQDFEFRLIEEEKVTPPIRSERGDVEPEQGLKPRIREPDLIGYARWLAAGEDFVSEAETLKCA